MSQISNDNAKYIMPQKDTIEYEGLYFLEACYGHIELEEEALEYYGQYLEAKKMEEQCVCYQYYREYFLRKFYEELWKNYIPFRNAAIDMSSS